MHVYFESPKALLGEEGASIIVHHQNGGTAHWIHPGGMYTNNLFTIHVVSQALRYWNIFFPYSQG